MSACAHIHCYKHPQVRKHLKTEFSNLLVEGTDRATSEVSVRWEGVCEWLHMEVYLVLLVYLPPPSPFLFPPIPTQSQSHGKIVRKLSKKLKVTGRRMTPPNEFMLMRPSSPVLSSSLLSHTASPRHLPSLLEESGSNSSSQNNSFSKWWYPLECRSCDLCQVIT